MSYEHLLKTVVTRLPGAGTDAVALEISNAMREFCLVTGVWRETVERNLLKGRVKYEITPHAQCTEVNNIVRLTINGSHYRPLGGDETGFRMWGGAFQVQENMGTVVINPAPTGDVPKGIKAVVTLRPAENDTSMPCELVSRHMDALVDGSLERLFRHVNKPYTNLDLANYHHRRFRAAITRTRRMVRGGNAHATPPWLFPQVAPGRRLRGSRTYGA